MEGRMDTFSVWGKVLHPVSVPYGTGYIKCLFQINEGMMLYPHKHHPDRKETQIVGNSNNCQVEPAGGSHTQKKLSKS